ncbi:MAG: MFS transporter [Pirellulaceae bacterium]
MKSQTNLIGFCFLNICQFFTAGNDNVLKQVLIFGVAAGGLWAGMLGEGAQAYASLALSIPFVVFSGFAGQFSDKYSKRTVCVVVKLAEVAIAVIALWGFLIGNVWIVLAAMILISVQSAFFTPAKFGILPEIVEQPKLSRANGTLNMFTYIAIIFGSALGGMIYDAYAPDPQLFPNAQPQWWLPGSVILVVAILGAAAAFGIPRLKPQDPDLKLKPWFTRMYIETWRDIRGSAVASVIIAWSFFYMIVGGVALLILPDYKDLLGISATQTSLLFALMGISIGVGDFVAGRVSGHGIRPELIPLGGVSTTLLFFVLAFLPLQFWVVLVALSATGFMAGFVMVPLQTMTQELSSDSDRGQVLGLWNCMSFVGIIIGNVLFLAVRIMGMPSNKVFIICGLLGVIFVGLYYSRWKRMFAEAVQQAELVG